MTAACETIRVSSTIGAGIDIGDVIMTAGGRRHVIDTDWRGIRMTFTGRGFEVQQQIEIELTVREAPDWCRPRFAITETS